MKATQSFDYKNVSKIKLKKNALDEVDIEKEWRKDPKYKTELCKSYEAKGICVYGNKCRFAHGKSELFMKPINLNNYKQKECFSFYTQGFCAYGKRCHFIHNEKNFHEIKRSYYSYLLSIYPLYDLSQLNEQFMVQPSNNSITELNSPIHKYSRISSKSINSTISTISNDSLQTQSCYIIQNNIINIPRSRLNVFNKIYLNSVKRNLVDSFSSCEHQAYMMNCNYQSIISLI